MAKNELLERNMSDFLKGIDTREKWENSKEKIMELFLREEYGFLPKSLTPTIKTEPQGINFAGKAHWERVTFTFENNGKSHSVDTELVLPENKTKIPVFLLLDFEHKVPSKYFPTEEILDGGFGVMSLCYKNVTDDNGDFTDGLCGLFEDCGCGKITIWAYMAIKCLDYLKSLENVGDVAIIGHSRLGKTALLASALDNRFALTCVNNSGCCGTALSRGKNDENETIKKITEVFPYWFTSNFYKYIDNEDSLPFDQHLLIAQIAPRPIMVGCAIKDVWADNEGSFISCQRASKIWELYGKRGLVAKNGYPRVNESLLDGEISFHLRDGEHFLSRYDWNVYMKKFKEILDR